MARSIYCAHREFCLKRSGDRVYVPLQNQQAKRNKTKRIRPYHDKIVKLMIDIYFINVEEDI